MTENLSSDTTASESMHAILLIDEALNKKENQKSKLSFNDYFPFIILGIFALIFLLILILTIILHLKYQSEINRLNMLIEKMSMHIPQPFMAESRFGYKDPSKIIDD